MELLTKRLLKICAALICALVCLAGCGEKNGRPAAVVGEEITRPPEYIVFDGESISLDDYASLTSLYESSSFNETEIADGAELSDGMYELHEFISSLSAAEAGALSKAALGALNRSRAFPN